jgi:hypothetical protein
MTKAKSPSTKHGSASSNTLLHPVLQSHLGHDPVLQWLGRAGGPLTVKRYVELAWNEGMPDPLDGSEQELLDALREHERLEKLRDDVSREELRLLAAGKKWK